MGGNAHHVPSRPLGYALDAGQTATFPSVGLGFGSSAEEVAQRALEARAREAEATADASALWQLADQHIPSDIREFGVRHGMPELTAEIWRSAFAKGWREAHKALCDSSPKDGTS